MLITCRRNNNLWNHKSRVQNNNQQSSDSDETNNSTPESATDSSLDTSSIEVIQPHEGLEIRLPINPLQ